MTNIQYIDQDDLRAEFCAALSRMYKLEVPLYGDLVELVNAINDEVEASALFNEDRVRVERHGAIRLGKASELEMIARLFGQMGMYPVNYYDLSTSGLPVHATAFRPITTQALAKNPFRVFTSLLRPELIPDEETRAEAEAILERRQIFSKDLRRLVDKAESQGGLDRVDASTLILEALETFKWHDTAEIPRGTYERMKSYHPLLADIVGFRGPHINHLTPRVLDIDMAQRMMAQRNITPKLVIEGPPKRHCPILLRQTSFQALNEPVKFPGSSPGNTALGLHRARFGEIELRGCALTQKDENSQKSSGSSPTDDNDKHQRRLEATFAQFPDDWETLRKERLAYFRYTKLTADPNALNDSLDALIERGVVGYLPIEYEDFLPASAAGIFRSNLGDDGAASAGGSDQQELFEKCLGEPVRSHWELYEEIQNKSLADIHL